MVVYYSTVYSNTIEHHVNYPTAAEALKEASIRASWFWVHRVEVWNGNFRLLLAVH